MELTGAQILLESLIKQKVKVVFGFPGGAIMPVYHYLKQYPQLHHILVRHEQGAAHAADGYARASGKVGVCLATSGPGATNLVTGIANAYLDSVPLVAITGQVATDLIGSDAFQECDVSGITMPIVKHNYLITKANEVAPIIKEAFHLASTGRPGPVVIDFAKTAQLETTEFIYPKEVNLPGYNPKLEGNFFQIKKAAQLLNQSEKPIILAGHGIIISQAEKIFTCLAKKANIPVATTLLGISCFPQNSNLYLGMPGMHGTIQANKATYNADVIFAIGMRFDDRITGKLTEYAPLAKIIHLDIDPAEIGKNVAVDIPIVGDTKKVLMKMITLIKAKKRLVWFKQINQWKKQMTSSFSYQPTGKTGHLSASYVVKTLSNLTDGKANIVADVGQNQMFTANHYQYNRFNSHFSAGGLGPMGWGVPAGLGVTVARPKELTWVICGDGGFQMTNQELITLVQEKLNLKIMVFNNGFLGMVRQWQEMFFNKNYAGTILINPDFIKLAEASFIKAQRVTKPSELKSAIKRANNFNGSYLLEIMVEPEENVFPMVAPGTSINQIVLNNDK